MINYFNGKFNKSMNIKWIFQDSQLFLTLKFRSSNAPQVQIDPAFWLSRASALIRVEEERRRQEELMQMLLNPAAAVAQLMSPNWRGPSNQAESASVSKNPGLQSSLAKRRKLSSRNESAAPSMNHFQQPPTTVSNPIRPPPLTLGKPRFFAGFCSKSL